MTKEIADMVNMMKLMQQAASMQKNVQKLQAELAEREYTFSSGGGAVTATVRGDMRLAQLKLNPNVVDPGDVEMLEDLITVAVNGAFDAARESAAAEMSKITGGMSIPGL
jgi:DNA-binding YbaB/EbfC family protein